MKLSDLKIHLFADGADLKNIEAHYRSGIIHGFTTNPTLMRKAGVTDYEKFARAALEAVTDLPISFEVFSDDFQAMEREARIIASWGGNVNVKIPITNTKGQSSAGLIQRLSADGIQLNITAILEMAQVQRVLDILTPGVDTIISVFAGRIADTGRDPVPVMQECLNRMQTNPRTRLLWASSRELLNIFQADAIGCHIITVTDGILQKLSLIGKDLGALSLDTVQMFYNDAQSAGYRI